MALDHSPDFLAHRFYVLVLFFSVLVISTCDSLQLDSCLVNFWAHDNIVCLI